MTNTWKALLHLLDFLIVILDVRILRSPLVHIVAMIINNNYNREILNVHLADGLGSQIIIGDNCTFLDLLGQQCTGTADGCKINNAGQIYHVTCAKRIYYFIS